MIGEQQSQGLNHMKSRGGLKVLQILAHISNCITLYNSDVGANPCADLGIQGHTDLTNTPNGV